MSVVHEMPSSCRKFSLGEIQKATNNFESGFLGNGAFGNVYKGVVADRSSTTTSTVAVKRLGQGTRESFETEIQMLTMCRHCNVVNLVGYCNEDPEMILVYEYMSEGNLADCLYRNQVQGGSSFLSWEQRVKICLGVARGLDYLHTGTGLSNRIIHLDVKSDNILLDDNFAAKIADLGLSRKGPAGQPNSEVESPDIRGTEGYIDPRYRETYTYSRKADVYSFGVVLLEVLTGTPVWGNMIIPEHDQADWIQQHIRSQTLHQIIDSMVATEIQPKCLERFAYTACKSLQNDPKKRPSMSQVVALLESALNFQSSSPDVDDQDDHFNVGYDEVSTTSSRNSAGDASIIENFIPEYLVMASNVFGEAIGNDTMLQMRRDATRENRAHVAYERMEFDNKYEKALSFLQDQNKKSGNGFATLCMIYNATGETLNYVRSHNQKGDIGLSPYPTIICNGQWGVYLHTSLPGITSASSVGAVVYRGKYSDNALCDRLITWSNRFISLTNKVYCEINEEGYFDTSDWDSIFKMAKHTKSAGTCSWKNCFTMVNIADKITDAIINNTNPIYKAVFRYGDIVPTMDNTNGR